MCTVDKKPIGTPYKSLYELFGAPAKAAERFDGRGEADTTSWMCYSSGTTGLPKGVELSNYTITSQLQLLSVVFDLVKSGEDRVIAFLPFSHIFGLVICILQGLSIGVPVVVMPRFDPDSVFAAIERVSWYGESLCD